MNEEQPKKELTELETRYLTLTEEFETLASAYNMQESALKTQQELITKARSDIEEIQKDLELRPKRYGMSNTRKLARDAFDQSTVEAHFANLGEHPIFKTIYEKIDDKRNEQEKRIEDILRRFENQPNSREFLEQLKDSWFYKEFKEELEILNVSYENLSDVQKVDRHNIYEKINLQRDTIADIQTANDLKDFLQSEMIIAYDGAFIFLMGALAEMGKGEIEKGLRFMLRDRKPKVEKDDGKKTVETPETPEE